MNVTVNSGFRTRTAVIGSQYARGVSRLRESVSATATVAAKRTPWRKTAERKLKFASRRGNRLVKRMRHGRRFSALRTLLDALRGDVGGHFNCGADLAADGVHLAARIAHGGDEKCSVGAFVGFAERFGFDVHGGEPCVVDLERRIVRERFADGGHHVRNGFEEVLDHFGGSESEFFAAHAAQQAAESEEPEARAFGLIEERAETFADGAVIGDACGEGLLRARCWPRLRRGSSHQLRGIGGGFAEREIEVRERAALGIVGVDWPEQNREKHLKDAATEGEGTGLKRAFGRQDLCRKNDQHDDADDALAFGGRAHGDGESSPESPEGSQQYGERRRSGPARPPAMTATAHSALVSQHALRALPVRIVAVGI